ncbi:MAG TPA: hypothetical protein PLQ76_07815, partial [bacterium]|nr:hypothetical protein [bacterium]
FFVKGLFAKENPGCPESPSGDSSDWLIEDLAKNCMFVHGPAPMRDSNELAPGDLLTIKAKLIMREVEGKTSFYLEMIQTESAPANKAADDDKNNMQR